MAINTNERSYYAKEFSVKTAKDDVYKILICECGKAEARYKVIIENNSYIAIYEILDTCHNTYDTTFEELNKIVELDNKKYSFITYQKQNGNNN